jgi:squalene-associated FAD-dependent desaturase
MAARVLILGAGLSGFATATALATRGFRVTLLEARDRLGGRAASFREAASGQLVDACQHVSMGCCTNFLHFCRTVGVAHFLQTQPHLYFMTPDRQVSTFQPDPLPAPFHLGRTFWNLHHLTTSEKARIAYALASLRLTNPDADPPFAHWLRQHHQTPRTVERFWSLVLTSALNETTERIGLKYARKVFVDGFLRHRRGFEVQLPTVPLSRLYGEEMQHWLDTHEVRLLLNHAARRLLVHNGSVRGVELRQGTMLAADWVVSAVPFDRLLHLLPAEVVAGEAYFGNLQRLETSPITSVHLWYDRPATEMPHAVLVDCVGQWVFNRGVARPGDRTTTGATPEGEHYLQVVVSAARQFRGLGHEEVRRLIVAEMGRLFPTIARVTPLRVRVVTEQAATFSAVPGVDRWRPPQTSPLDNLFVAGDWTATGWPATMEGAVRSGYLAAEALLRRLGTPQRIVRPDLRGSW